MSKNEVQEPRLNSFSLYLNSSLTADGSGQATLMIPCEFCNLPQAGESLIRHQVCAFTHLKPLKREIFFLLLREEKKTFAYILMGFDRGEKEPKH